MITCEQNVRPRFSAVIWTKGFFFFFCIRCQALSPLSSLCGVKTAFRMSAEVELRSRQKKQCVTDTGKMLPCQVILNENSKYNLTPIFHVMKILMMHERGIFLDVFALRPLLKETGNVIWNLLSPLNWFHYGTSNYKSTIQEKRGRQGVEVWAFLSSQEGRMSHSNITACPLSDW